MPKSKSSHLSRRGFVALSAAAPLLAQAIPQNTPVPKRKELPPETLAFGETIEFASKPPALAVQPFSLTEVRILSGPFLEAQQASLGYMQRLAEDRLVHNFRINAGLSSSAKPFGGWEAPDCELRGHFTGHYLSACALMYSSSGNKDIKAKGDAIVEDLAKCQAKLGGAYLSAFPAEFFDRLNARQKVWAPFYTIHKIMAGMYDMSQLCGNAQAMNVLRGMADWADKWTAQTPEPHMQDILNTEYGGMNEVLYNLAAVTGEARYARVGDRFTKKKFFNPLAARRDELRGLHVNTHIPQVIGAARRYEISGDERFHDVADYFWYEITTARAYVTGGTSNNELWLTEPRRLAAELSKGIDTTECCCAYNMLKLTRQLYTWTGDPRYFDYYERVLYNHRLGALDPANGHTQYYLSLAPGAWKTFNGEDDSFWCCTGTGVEEFAKLANSIYFHDAEGVYVNLFIASELNWKDKGLTIRQENNFPDSSSTTLKITAAQPVRMNIRLRIPSWAASGVTVKVNGRALDASASPGSYLTLTRTWQSGDRIEMEMPMGLHVEKMPDQPTMQAVLYGPIVLAGDLGTRDLTDELIVGRGGPALDKHPISVPSFRAANADPESWIKQTGGPLSFETYGQEQNVAFAPFNRTFRKRYSVYWIVS